MDISSLDDFYQQMTTAVDTELSNLLPNGINKEIGHFSIFNVEDLIERVREKPFKPYN